MIQFELIKSERSNGKFVYTVLNQKREIVYITSPTRKIYIAFTLRKREGAYEVLNRFGRHDLLGKGDSKSYWGRPDIFIATIDEHKPGDHEKSRYMTVINPDQFAKMSSDQIVKFMNEDRRYEIVRNPRARIIKRLS